MQVGEVHNGGAAEFGKPLDGIRVLAVEQMQALPYATQMLARLGAEVVRIEHPTRGDSGRSASPSITDPTGRPAGSTFLRNNLGKASIGIDIATPQGRDLVLALVQRYDVFGENFAAGVMKRRGLAYEDVAAVHPNVVYVSLSGFGNREPSPYDGWPAYAGVAEAMSSLYSWSTPSTQPPRISPLGALGDTVSGIYAALGVLAALRHRDAIGTGQHVDIAMYDCLVSLADVQLQFASMGIDHDPTDPGPRILDAFRADDGYFMVQVGREHQLERFAQLIGCPEWLDDPRFATREGWGAQVESVVRPAVERWAAGRTKLEAASLIAATGVAAGPCNAPADVLADPHVAARAMVVEAPRPDGAPGTVAAPGNPVKLSRMTEGPETRVPWLGEHTDAVLSAELGLTDGELAALRDAGIISGMAL